MDITLPKDLEEFVIEKVREGSYANPSELMPEALRKLRAKEDPADSDSEELAELLLPAMRGNHHSLSSEHFAQLRQRIEKRLDCE
jgi:putative addiction module CopG family antidote